MRSLHKKSSQLKLRPDYLAALEQIIQHELACLIKRFCPPVVGVAPAQSDKNPMLKELLQMLELHSACADPDHKTKKFWDKIAGIRRTKETARETAPSTLSPKGSPDETAESAPLTVPSVD